MPEKEMVIVSETHWDREWYLPFQEFRAKLIILTDKLLEILKNDPKFANFTFDGQTIILEDYLEVKPENESLLRRYITEGRISVGPWYVLPDEFLVSGEALIRNLMLGHKIARSFGRVMRAGYIPDPFGHVAQLPQILQGFGIDSAIFMRGMDDSAERLGLNWEFFWDSPGKCAAVLAIHLRHGYGSVAGLPTNKSDNIYKAALRKIKKVQQKLLKSAATPILLLNNGSDHNEVQGELPAIVEDWNKSPELSEYKLVQQDFEYYIEKLKTQELHLKRYQGEFRGARYHPILSGVFSARMWIKQLNTECQCLLESWAEPSATFAWLLGETYPFNYIWTSWKWLLRNHPHDSICGCSIDEVHRDMIPRFVWAKQIAEEVTKDAMYAIYKRIDIHDDEKDRIPFLIFNTLPWARTDIASVNITLPSPKSGELEFYYKLFNSSNQEIPYQITLISEKSRIQTPKASTYNLTFLAKEIPACGYEVFYLEPQTEPFIEGTKKLKTEIENEFYKIIIHENGTFTIIDKDLGLKFEKGGILEDVGDWGDEYDYSPPHKIEADLKITNEDVSAEIEALRESSTIKSVFITYNLGIPDSLTQDRTNRSGKVKKLTVDITFTLYSEIKRIDLRIEINNQSKDHRLRILFPTRIKSEKISVDGHFAVIERPVHLPQGIKWKQPPSKTNHQLKFVSVSDKKAGFTVCNRGLPEYEAIIDERGEITFAITLLRSIGWLALPNLVTRNEIAGPALATPEAQCLGKSIFNLSIITHNAEFSLSDISKNAIDFNLPLKTFNPGVMRTALRVPDHIFFRGIPLLMPTEPEEVKSLDLRQSFLEITPNNLVLSACKKAEEDSALIVRIYNISPSPCTGRIKLFRSIQEIKVVNMDEKEINDTQITDISLNNEQFSFQIVGSKIATFKITLKT